MRTKNQRKRKYITSQKRIKKKKDESIQFLVNTKDIFRRKKWKKYIKTKKYDIKRFIAFILIIIIFLITYIIYISIKRNKVDKENKRDKRDKVIISIFAGRKKHLEILMTYLKYLLFHNKISEVHLWLFTNNNNEIEYIRSISNLHKTNGNFKDYVNIYPEIKNNIFYIKLKMKKNGACILINDKYEIIFNIDDTRNMKITLKIDNNYFSENQNIKYDGKEFLEYIIQIVNNKLSIKGKNKFEIIHSIDEKDFNTIKIRSLSHTETFWDYKESKNMQIKLFDTIRRYRGGWYEMFKFYLTYDFDIFIKMDDDIVYLDVERFDEYINYIKAFKKNITFPNLVNHAISLFYNNKGGLIPNSEIKGIYQNRNSAGDIYYYFRDGQQGKKIHQYFLNNIDKFIHNNLNPVLLNGLKPSICSFGISKESYVKAYSPYAIWPKTGEPYNYLFNDEVYSYNLLNNYLYPRYIFIHYAFEPQRNSGLDDNFLLAYKNLSNRYIIRDDKYNF